MILLLLIGGGCKSMHNLAPDASILDEVQVGNKVQAITEDGAIHTFIVGKVDENQLAGTSENGLYVSLDPIDINSMEVEQIDPGLTALAVIGGIVAIPLVVVGVTFACLAGGCQ
jgi:hypothetical protein